MRRPILLHEDEVADGLVLDIVESGVTNVLEGLFIDRMDQNEDITARFMNEDDFKKLVGQHLLKEVYERIRSEDKSTGG